MIPRKQQSVSLIINVSECYNQLAASQKNTYCKEKQSHGSFTLLLGQAWASPTVVEILYVSKVYLQIQRNPDYFHIWTILLKFMFMTMLTYLTHLPFFIYKLLDVVNKSQLNLSYFSYLFACTLMQTKNKLTENTDAPPLVVHSLMLWRIK